MLSNFACTAAGTDDDSSASLASQRGAARHHEEAAVMAAHRRRSVERRSSDLPRVLEVSSTEVLCIRLFEGLDLRKIYSLDGVNQ